MEQTIKAAETIIEKETVEINLEEEDDETKYDGFEGFNGSGRTITLQMLLAANVLQPGKSTMTIEYLGQKFVGDLLPDGKIKSHETETIFLSPSAWAMHCKRIINPDKKSGCGWASVKYKGKKLDAYKAIWLKKYAQQKDPSEDDVENEFDKSEMEQLTIIQRVVVPHNTINNRNLLHDANTLIETVTFATLSKMQPFFIAITSNALLLADFHCHLTLQEVCGYFGGSWDINTHTLVITKAYPCKNTKYDREKAPEVEADIQKSLIRDQLILVGWYHSHPKFPALPTLRDCDSQLEAQIKMRGPSDLTYTPCVAFIFSPYYEETEESSITPFWVVPPPENRQILEYGRPVYMQYDVTACSDIDDALRLEMQLCIQYYSKFRSELIDFNLFYNKNIKYIEKLLIALYNKFPDNQNDLEFWNWICQLLKCDAVTDFQPPPILKLFSIKKTKPEDLGGVKDDLKKDLNPELKVLSLQEQLSLPSGLNMNPTKLIPSSITSPFTINTGTGASPNESPIPPPPSSSVSPPVRSSPSPAKSDSSRPRSSPISNKFLYDLTAATNLLTSPKNKTAAGLANPELFSQLFLPSDLTMTMQEKEPYVEEPSTSKLITDLIDEKSAVNEFKKQNQYKTKLMKELEDLKTDPIKISEILRSPEYAALLLQQAEMLGASAFGSMGLTPSISSTDLLSGRYPKTSQFNYNSLLNNKIFGFDSASSAGASTSKSVKLPKESKAKNLKQPDYASVLQQYAQSTSELSNLLSLTSGDKKKDNLLSSFLKNDKDSTDLNNMLFFNSSKTSSKTSPATSDSSNKSQPDLGNFFPKDMGGIDYAALFQQAHGGKFNIPDPLSKSTLAANNMFMSPSVLLKMQQESLNAMMMKPPKSSPSPTSKMRENTISNILSGSAATDITKQSEDTVQSNLAADLTRIYGELPKKRMEFSSIADLVSSPSSSSGPSAAKIPKSNSQDDILNLSAKE